MLSDKDFWKKEYSFLWDKSGDREKLLAEFIEKETGVEVELVGLGAGNNEFIHGSASDNDKEKGAPDLHIKGTNIYIEVTGSFSPTTKAGDDLWFRPDKLTYAHRHRKEMDEFLVNNFIHAGEWYVIHCTDDFWKYLREAYDKKIDFQEIHPKIRGNKERCIAIKSGNPYVKDLDSLIEYIKQHKGGES